MSLPDDNDMIVIRPAGHFQDGTASSVVLQDGGVMVLDGEALTGRFVSPVLPVDEFDGVMFSMRSDVPDGTVIVVFIRFFTGDSPGPWTKVDVEDEFHFDDRSVSAFQYRVLMHRPSANVPSPVFRDIDLLTDRYDGGYDFAPSDQTVRYAGVPLEDSGLSGAPSGGQATEDEMAEIRSPPGRDSPHGRSQGGRFGGTKHSA